ncbi:CACNA1S [Symbiodinium natans]|uniref:CACNA1S protein n=1 Tax=Symbiodinium natans TaxID=878477 RepID=A0A812TCP6_9DINO|nr:CACNA1S [Symbiodinium natans]
MGEYEVDKAGHSRPVPPVRLESLETKVQDMRIGQDEVRGAIWVRPFKTEVCVRMSPYICRALQFIMSLMEDTATESTASLGEVNDSIRELRIVVDGELKRHRELLLDLSLQVTRMSESGKSFFRQSSVDSPVLSAMTLSADFAQAGRFQKPDLSSSFGSRGLLAPPTLRRNSHTSHPPGVTGERSRNAPDELPEMSGRAARHSVHCDLEAMKAKAKSTFSNQTSSHMKGSRRAARIVSSKFFSTLVAALIFLNLVLLGAEVDASANLPVEEQLQSFYVLNIILVAIFVAEVVLKICAYTCRGFLMGPEKLWNVFDFLIVLLSVLEIIVDLLAQALAEWKVVEISSLRIMRFARLVRALRGIRVIRVIRYISGLRTILFSIASTMSSVLWTMVLLLMIFFCFGVLIAQISTDYCRQFINSDSTCAPQLLRFWPSVMESMLTLFLSITGGCWRHDKDALQTENMANFMQSLDISTQDVWTLFTVIDADGSGEISLDEFVFGCMQVQGPAKGVQMARLQHETTIVRNKIKSLRRDVERLKTEMSLAASKDTSSLERAETVHHENL